MSTSLAKQHFGWYMYDWANSAFSATVVTVFLGPYLTAVAKSAAGSDGLLHVLGMSLEPGSWFAYTVSLSVIVQVLVLPLVGSLTDASSRKKTLLGSFAILGALCTTLLFFLQTDQGNYVYGSMLFIIANAFFGASIVVYNAFIPIVQPDTSLRDKLSSRGWALGYLGGGLLLLANLLYYKEASSTQGSLAVRICLASAGIWWALFTLVPLALLPRGKRVLSARADTDPSEPRLSFLATITHLTRYPQTMLFLGAYLLYNDAVQTVIAMASQFGSEELHLGLDTLTQAILIVQFVAIGGSLLFERIATWLGTKQAIVVSLLGWVGVLIAAYAFVATELHFYILAAVIALVMGGTQALSRSYYSTMIPAGYEASYFSLYELSDKGTSWIGPLVFGLALNITHSYRAAVLSLVVFFIAGIVMLMFVKGKNGGEKAVAN